MLRPSSIRPSTLLPARPTGLSPRTRVSNDLGSSISHSNQLRFFLQDSGIVLKQEPQGRDRLRQEDGPRLWKAPSQLNSSPGPLQLGFFCANQLEKEKRIFSSLLPRCTFSLIQEVAPMSYIDLEQAKVPGPGRYEEFVLNETPKWSMRPRVDSDCNSMYNIVFPKTTVLDVPAPSTYSNTEAIGMNPSGKYHLSRYPNSKAKVFNPPRSRRFNKSSLFYSYTATDVPGPGVYKPVNDLSSDAKYVLSKNRGAGNRAFMHGQRHSFTDLAAKRSFSTSWTSQLLGLAVTDPLLILDTTTARTSGPGG